VTPGRRQEVSRIGKFNPELSPDDDHEYPVESDQPNGERRKHAKGIRHRGSSEDGQPGRLMTNGQGYHGAGAPARLVRAPAIAPSKSEGAAISAVRALAASQRLRAKSPDPPPRLSEDRRRPLLPSPKRP